jgi:hypothetical protein
MSKHIVKMDDLLADPVVKHTLCASYGKGSNKKLDLIIDIDKRTFNFHVVNEKVCVFSTNMLSSAIERYNKLP